MASAVRQKLSFEQLQATDTKMWLLYHQCCKPRMLTTTDKGFVVLVMLARRMA